MPLTPRGRPYPPSTGVAPDVPYWMQQAAETEEALATRPQVHVDGYAGGALVSGGYTAIPWSTAGTNEKPSSFWSGGTTFTVPDDGVYLITAHAAFLGPSTMLAGLAYTVGTERYRAGNQRGQDPECRMADTVKLFAGQAVKIEYYQTGATGTFTSNHAWRASIVKVSD